MMNFPNIPSFFKKNPAKGFKFIPRYYKKKLEKKHKIKFKRNIENNLSTGRSKRIIFIIIVLSLLAYYFLK